MRYCRRCCYPENAKPTIIFDEEGVCSGCRYHESREATDIDWEEREKMLVRILEKAKKDARKRGNIYDCIIPVSGGKDSHFQTYLLKEKYGINPLLVAFNHTFNTPAGNRNLENLVQKSGCDLYRVTPSPHSVQKVSRFMLERVGDLTWHYHAGIYTVPFQISAQKNIPLIVWGEHGYAELTGMFSIRDFVEFTRWTRKQYDMRGLDVFDVVNDDSNDIEITDMASYIFPSTEEMERIDMQGIYLSNFINWEAKEQTEFMIKTWDFAPVTFKRDRTFNLYSHIEDHANEVHDYMKFLKFGYGRATDAVSREIRLGRLQRKEGVEMVREYDHVKPSSLDTYLDLFGMTEEEFHRLFDNQRAPDIWERGGDGEWQLKDAVYRQETTGEHDRLSARLNEADHIFAQHNRHLYYNPDNPPLPSGDPRLDRESKTFSVI